MTLWNAIFLNENVRIAIRISLKFVPKYAKGPINTDPALVQIMAQATSHYPNQWWLAYWRIYVSLGLNELMAPVNGMVDSVSRGRLRYPRDFLGNGHWLFKPDEMANWYHIPSTPTPPFYR